MEQCAYCEETSNWQCAGCGKYICDDHTSSELRFTICWECDDETSYN